MRAGVVADTVVVGLVIAAATVEVAAAAVGAATVVIATALTAVVAVSVAATLHENLRNPNARSLDSIAEQWTPVTPDKAGQCACRYIERAIHPQSAKDVIESQLRAGEVFSRHNAGSAPR